MNLESIVTNLELSKKLCELGVKQDSIFYYVEDPYNKGEIFEITRSGEDYFFITPNKYSAFTASELLELLPDWSDIYKRDTNDYHCRVFEKDSDICHHSFDENMCDAFAKMLIHLIENKLIEV